jgi:hypothetical protein
MYDWRPLILMLGPLSGWFLWQWMGLELKWPSRREQIGWLMSGNAGLGLFILFVIIRG